MLRNTRALWPLRRYMSYAPPSFKRALATATGDAGIVAPPKESLLLKALGKDSPSTDAKVLSIKAKSRVAQTRKKSIAEIDAIDADHNRGSRIFRNDAAGKDSSPTPKTRRVKGSAVSPPASVEPAHTNVVTTSAVQPRKNSTNSEGNVHTHVEATPTPVGVVAKKAKRKKGVAAVEVPVTVSCDAGAGGDAFDRAEGLGAEQTPGDDSGAGSGTLIVRGKKKAARKTAAKSVDGKMNETMPIHNAIISVDVGAKNLAWAHVTRAGCIHEWRLVDLDLPPIFSPNAYASKLKTFVDSLPPMFPVAIERQRHRSGGVSSVLEHVFRVNIVEAMLHALLQERAFSVLPRLTQSIFSLGNSPVKKKNAIVVCDRILANSGHFSSRKRRTAATAPATDPPPAATDIVTLPEHLFAMYETSKKRDDLSDCLLQALAYFKATPPPLH